MRLRSRCSATVPRRDKAEAEDVETKIKTDNSSGVTFMNVVRASLRESVSYGRTNGTSWRVQKMESKSSRPEYSMMTRPLPFLSSILTLRPRVRWRRSWASRTFGS